MGNDTTFNKLNHGWNAEPNAPAPEILFNGNTLKLRFRSYTFESNKLVEEGYSELVFTGCTRYRMNDVNDHAWFQGDCRFSELAPEWGEFYEVGGDFLEDVEVDVVDGLVTGEWTALAPSRPSQKNFLFYFRDETFECSATNWTLDKLRSNTEQENSNVH